MRLRERAEEVISEIDAGLYYTSDEEKERVLNHIEQVIKNAIEEDRKTRECCKAEREACGAICDETAKRLRMNICATDSIEYAATLLEEVGEQIRARSDS